MAVGKIDSPRSALISVLLPRFKSPQDYQIKAILPQLVDELGNIRILSVPLKLDQSN